MLVKTIGEALEKAKLTFVLVIPPPITNQWKPGMIDHDDIKAMFHYVDYFSMMTYDYSNPERPGYIIAIVIFRDVCVFLSRHQHWLIVYRGQ